jgi:hypothetical protein
MTASVAAHQSPASAGVRRDSLMASISFWLTRASRSAPWMSRACGSPVEATNRTSLSVSESFDAQVASVTASRSAPSPGRSTLNTFEPVLSKRTRPASRTCWRQASSSPVSSVMAPRRVTPCADAPANEPTTRPSATSDAPTIVRARAGDRSISSGSSSTASALLDQPKSSAAHTSHPMRPSGSARPLVRCGRHGHDTP